MRTFHQDDTGYRWYEFPCAVCGAVIDTPPGRDATCGNCGSWHNSSGQLLRDDWYANPSCHDSDIGDLDGYEIQHAGH